MWSVQIYEIYETQSNSTIVFSLFSLPLKERCGCRHIRDDCDREAAVKSSRYAGTHGCTERVVHVRKINKIHPKSKKLVCTESGKMCALASSEPDSEIWIYTLYYSGVFLPL